MRKQYAPPPTVEKFLQSEKQYSFIIGPIGSGKTTGGLAKIMYHAARQDRSPVDGKRRTRFLVIRNTFKELQDTTIKSFFMWFPPGVAGHWMASQRQFTFDSGDIHCEVLFRALDNPDDVSSLLSLELTGVFFDEFVELAREVIDVAESRTSRYPQKEAYMAPAGTQATIADVGDDATDTFIPPMRKRKKPTLLAVRHKYGVSRFELPKKGGGAHIDAPDGMVAGATVTLKHDTALKSRCTWKGVWGSSNAGTQDSWWYDWLYAPWEGDDDGAKKRTSLAYFEQPSGFSPDVENTENLADGDDYYTNKSNGKKPEWVKQFIECIWGFSQKGKPVYSAFRGSLHIADTELQYNPHLPLIMGFDAGLTPAAIFMQQDPFGRVLVLDELVSEGMGAQRFCREKIKPLLARRFPGCDLRIAADPAVTQRSQANEAVTVAKVLEQELKVKCEPAASNTLGARLGAVEGVLTRLTEAGPALLVDKRCKVLVTGFQAGYRYTISSKGVKADTPEKNSYSHPHDACQYGVMYFETGAQREERKRRRAQQAPIRYNNQYAVG